jgi:hypothetical protein
LRCAALALRVRFGVEEFVLEEFVLEELSGLVELMSPDELELEGAVVDGYVPDGEFG